MFALSKRSNSSARLDAIERSQAVIAFSLDGTVLEANPNFLALTGYRLDEVQGRHHSLFVDPAEAGSEAYRTFWQRLGRGEYQSGEFRRIANDGRVVWIRATYNPILDRAGRPVQIVKFALDITAEKRAAAEAEGQIAAIRRSQAVIHFGLDGTIEEANEHFLNAMGYGLDEIVGRPHRMFVEAAYGASAEYADFWRALARGEYRSGEFKRLAKDGREVWIQASYNPIFDAAGRPFKVVKYATDVTATKLAAAQMAAQVEAAGRSLAVIEFALDGTVLEANANFLAVTGYALDEVRGRHHRMFVKPEYAESPSYAAFWESLRAGRFASAVYQRVGKGGREVWIQATYNPVFDLNGQPSKVVKFATDVSKAMGVRARAIGLAEDTLRRIQAVSTASEEMHGTSGAIAGQMMQSKQAVEEIQAQMHSAGEAAAKLDQAAQAMNGVVETITSIAEQINLLALNATIEAARAGVAGRGFSVVATEVKSLAGQAQTATRGISGEIAAMQAVSHEVNAVLASMRTAADAVEGYIAQTARASEQQRQATGEVSANVQTSATGVAAIARNLDEWLVGIEERRASDRERTATPATIMLARADGGTQALPCMVVNLSATGAKLAIDAAHLPETFTLRFGHETRTCRLVRRGRDEAGVRFV